MKITHNKVGQNINTTDAKSEKASSAAKASSVKSNSKTSESGAADVAKSGSQQATKVELSQRVQDIKKAKEIAKNTPDVNAEKVAKFKQMIAEGKYKVDAKAVAEKMVDDAMTTAKSGN